MPHRPKGQGSSSVSPGGVVNASVYSPPRVNGKTAAAIMRQNSDTRNTMNKLSQQQAATTAGLQYVAHVSGVVTPVVKSKGGLPWLTAGNKSSDSTDRSTTDDSRSIATLATEDEREATASALLMVAKAAEREHQQQHLKGMVVDSSNAGAVLASVLSSASTCSTSTVPLKKRKKQLDILRRQQNHHQTVAEAEKEACHVSPVSLQSSVNPSPGNRAHSYDSKDLALGSSSMTSPQGETTQELLDSSKVHSTAQIGASGSSVVPISQVVIPHFPTVLHRVLADTGLTTEQGPAIRWLQDGESWKVENWNAMRRIVLPKYFSNLREEYGSSCGTIDAFLYQIDVWGFEEIKSGANAGAYRHNLFIRGAQKLCVKMQPTSDLASNADTNTVVTANVMNKDRKGPKTVSPGRSQPGDTDRMMLQVPMLAQADSKKQTVLPPNKRVKYENGNNTMGTAGHAPLHWSYANDAAGGMVWNGGPRYIPHTENPHARAYGMRAAVAMNASNSYASANGSYGMDPRMQLCRVPTSDSITVPRQQQPFQYTPPQVRSGRGAMRGVASATQQNRAAAVTSPSTTPAYRGFPVSNRGKGTRKSASCRTSLAGDVKQENKGAPSSDAKQQQSMMIGVSLTEAQRIGTSVKGVAVAISRKTKRKLPLAAQRKTDAKASAATDGSEQE